MPTALHDTIGTDPSPLDVAEHIFQLIACEPATLKVDGRMLGNELPPRPMLLTELRELLSARTTSNATRDVVWRHLIIQARTEGAQWLVGTVGVAVPMLRTVCGQICRDYVAGEPVDIDTEVLARFIEAIRTTDLDLPNVLPRMRDAAKHAGQRVRQLAESDASRSFPLTESAQPPIPYGHPDLVLADAVTKGVVSELDAELIGLTRLENHTLAQAGALLGLSPEAAKKRRQRAEAVLVDALLAEEVTSAMSPTITPELPRRVEEASARDRISSDPQPTPEPEGDWGTPTGPARTTTRFPWADHWPWLSWLLAHHGISWTSLLLGIPWQEVRQAARRVTLPTAGPPRREPDLLTHCRPGRRLAVVMLTLLLVAAMVAGVYADSANAAAAAAIPSDLNAVFTNLRNWLIGLLAALATLMLTIGGLRYLIAGGDPGEVQKAKTALKAAAFGYGLAILAPLFVDVLKRVVGG